MKHKRKLLAILLIAAVILAAGIGSAYAYFSDNTQANGVLRIKPMGTDIIERVIKREKHITITNAADGAEVFVRARAFSGDDADLTYSGEGWFDGGDGWWYYGSGGALTILKADSQTPELIANVEKVLPVDADPGQSLNVIVVYEAARVLYDADNAAYYADWEPGASISEGGES